MSRDKRRRMIRQFSYFLPIFLFGFLWTPAFCENDPTEELIKGISQLSETKTMNNTRRSEFAETFDGRDIIADQS